MFFFGAGTLCGATRGVGRPGTAAVAGAGGGAGVEWVGFWDYGMGENGIGGHPLVGARISLLEALDTCSGYGRRGIVDLPGTTSWPGHRSAPPPPGVRSEGTVAGKRLLERKTPQQETDPR